MARPHRHPAERLYTKIWFAEISAAAGNATPYWFWKNIAGGDGDKTVWRRYKTGARVPERAGDFDPIVAVEAKFPGTRRILENPVIFVLKGMRLTRDQARAAIAEIGDPYRRIILEGGYETSSNDSERELSMEEIFQQLSLFPSLALVEVIVLMLAWADDVGNSEFWNHICAFYRAMVPELVRCGHIPFHEELLELVDGFAQMRDYGSVTLRTDIHQSWRDLEPKHFVNQDRVRLEMLEYWHTITDDPTAHRTKNLR